MNYDKEYGVSIYPLKRGSLPEISIQFSESITKTKTYLMDLCEELIADLNGFLVKDFTKKSETLEFYGYSIEHCVKMAENTKVRLYEFKNGIARGDAGVFDKYKSYIFLLIFHFRSNQFLARFWFVQPEYLFSRRVFSLILSEFPLSKKIFWKRQFLEPSEIFWKPEELYEVYSLQQDKSLEFPEFNPLDCLTEKVAQLELEMLQNWVHRFKEGEIELFFVFPYL